MGNLDIFSGQTQNARPEQTHTDIALPLGKLHDQLFTTPASASASLPSLLEELVSMASKYLRNKKGTTYDHRQNHGDIYIMMHCVCVCVSRKMITSNLRAERWRREVSRPLGLAGRRPALA